MELHPYLEPNLHNKSNTNNTNMYFVQIYKKKLFVFGKNKKHQIAGALTISAYLCSACLCWQERHQESKGAVAAWFKCYILQSTRKKINKSNIKTRVGRVNLPFCATQTAEISKQHRYSTVGVRFAGIYGAEEICFFMRWGEERWKTAGVKE